MATYLELHSLANNGELQNRVAVALTIAAQTKLSSGTTSQQESKWARNVLANLDRESARVLRLILAANSSASLTNIQAATDTQIQTNVDNVVAGIVAGEV